VERRSHSRGASKTALAPVVGAPRVRPPRLGLPPGRHRRDAMFSGSRVGAAVPRRPAPPSPRSRRLAPGPDQSSPRQSARRPRPHPGPPAAQETTPGQWSAPGARVGARPRTTRASRDSGSWERRSARVREREMLEGATPLDYFLRRRAAHSVYVRTQRRRTYGTTPDAARRRVVLSERVRAFVRPGYRDSLCRYRQQADGQR
jgi:hypothetical protein